MSVAGNESGTDVWAVFLNAHAAVTRRLEEELLRECQIPGSWYEVLALLGNAADGRLRIQDLADSTLLTQGGVSRLVTRIEGAGLVRRSSSTSDRRVVHVELTSRGRRELRGASAVHARGIAEHFLRHVTDAELPVLRRTLLKVLHDATVVDEGGAGLASLGSDQA